MTESYNVLFVDDETDYLDTLIKRMSKRKINVTGVKSGEAALEFLKNMCQRWHQGIEPLRTVQ